MEQFHIQLKPSISLNQEFVIKMAYEEPPMRYNPALAKYTPNLPQGKSDEIKSPSDKKIALIFIVFFIFFVFVFVIFWLINK